MLSERLRAWTQGIRVSIAHVLGRLGFSPNALTILGYLLSLPVMYVLATGNLRIGGVLVALVSSFDALDGALARETGQSTTFGAFLDSVLDRYSEATILFGLLLWYLRNGAQLDAALIFATMVGSLLVSYTRARAEGIGVDCEVGLLTRVERAILTIAALILGLTAPALWILAIGTMLTAIHRMVYTYRQAKNAPLANP